MDDDDFDRLFKKPKKWAGDEQRVLLYGRALKEAWKQNPNRETHSRLTGFVRSQRLARLSWIDWVERNAETIPWCGHLVAAAVTCQLDVDR